MYFDHLLASLFEKCMGIGWLLDTFENKIQFTK